MSNTDWITIIAAIGGGLAIGLVASGIVSRVMERDSSPEALRNSAKPIASLVFSVCLVVGLVIALGVIRPSAVDELINDSVNFIPKLLVAVIILIVANVASTFAVTAMGTAMARMPLAMRQKASMAVKGLIVTLAAVLAVSTIGIDTDVVNMAIGSVFFAIAASFALLVGLGGNNVAKQVTAARALKRIVKVDDYVVVGNTEGKITELYPTSIEILDSDGTQTFIPASDLLNQTIKVTPSTQSR